MPPLLVPLSLFRFVWHYEIPMPRSNQTPQLLGAKAFLDELRDPGRNLKDYYKDRPLELADKMGVKLPEKPVQVMQRLGVYDPEKHGPITPGIREMVEDVCTLRVRSAVGCASRGGGKSNTCSTLVPTPSGWATMGELKAGDLVFNEVGSPVKVLIAHDPYMPQKLYRVSFSDGTHVDADGEHLWQTWTHMERSSWMNEQRKRGLGAHELPREWPFLRFPVRDNQGRVTGDRGPEVRTTQEIVDTFAYGSRGDRNHSIPIAWPLELPERKLPIDPWLLGYWLGNGSSTGSSIASGSKDGEMDADFVQASISQAGWDSAHRRDIENRGHSVFDLHISFKRLLESVGTLGTRKIPAQYLRASETQRLQLLRGLCDSNGYVDASKSHVEYCTTHSKKYATQVLELVRSLGERPVLSEGRASLNGEDVGPKWRVSWRPRIHNPFSLPRKARGVTPLGEVAQGFRHQHRMIVSIEEIEPEMVRCITVDTPSHLYLIGEGMIPTHNSYGASFIEFFLWVVLDFDALNLGGSELQADAVYQYVLNYIESDPYWRGLLRGDPQKEKTFTKEDSWIRVLAASQKSVRSPHAGGYRKGKMRGGILVIDEEAEADEGIVEAALFTINTAQPSVNLRISTFHNLGGSFQDVMDNAEEMGFTKYQWNIFDVCSGCDCPGPECGSPEPCFREDHYETYINPETGQPEEKLLHKAYCAGKARFADGWISMDEIETLWKRVKRSHYRWEIEAMGERPSSKGYVIRDLGRFTESITDEVGESLYVHGSPVYIGVDWGTSNGGVQVWQHQPFDKHVLIESFLLKDNNQTQIFGKIVSLAEKYRRDLVEVRADIGGGGNYLNESLSTQHRLRVVGVNFAEKKEAAVAVWNALNESGKVTVPSEFDEFINQVKGWKRKKERIAKGSDHLCDSAICYFSQFIEQMGMSHIDVPPVSFNTSPTVESAVSIQPGSSAGRRKPAAGRAPVAISLSGGRSNRAR